MNQKALEDFFKAKFKEQDLSPKNIAYLERIINFINNIINLYNQSINTLKKNDELAGILSKYGENIKIYKPNIAFDKNMSINMNNAQEILTKINAAKQTMAPEAASANGHSYNNHH